MTSAPILVRPVPNRSNSNTLSDRRLDARDLGIARVSFMASVTGDGLRTTTNLSMRTKYVRILDVINCCILEVIDFLLILFSTSYNNLTHENCSFQHTLQ